MTKTIMFLNRKGGTGKTTVAFNFAAHLARSRPKQRGLVIDLDSQTNLSQILAGQEPQRTNDANEEVHTRRKNWPPRPPGLLDVLRKSKTLAMVVRRHTLQLMATALNIVEMPEDCAVINANKAAGFDFILGHHHVDGWQTENVGMMGKALILERILREQATVYDWVVIDSPPGSGFALLNGIWAADSAVLVARPGEGFMWGIDLAIDEIESTRSGGIQRARDIKIIGVLQNMWAKQSASQRATQELEDAGYRMFGPLPQRPAFMNATYLSQDIYAHGPAHTDSKSELPSAHITFHVMELLAIECGL